MLRLNFMRLLFLLLFPGLAFSAILPETIGSWQRGPSAPAPAPDSQVWREYGLQDSEIAPYSAGGRAYTISAYRFTDATGALAAFEDSLPDGAKPVQVTDVGAVKGEDQYVAVGNYLFVFKGYKPTPEELNHVVGEAPRYQQSPLPTLPKYLPPDPVEDSQRYIVGPESLARFAPSIPPSTAAFHFNAEAALARYGSPGREATVLVFSYPTMEMARDRLPHFQQIPGAVVKRTGPLIALTLNAPNPDTAEKLLSQVRYQAEVTVPEHVPTLKDNPANLFWNIFILCGILAALCLVAGLFVGGLRLVVRRGGESGEGDEMITLHLSGRP